MEDLFERIIKREIPAEIVYEDDNFIAFLDIKPVNPGHTLILPKKKSVNILDADNETLSKIGPVVKKVAKAILLAVDSDDFNLHVNNGAAAGQAVFHMHWHIIPRKNGDGYTHWHGQPTSPEELKEIALKIKSNL